MPQQITDFSSPFLFDDKVKKKTLKNLFCTLATKPPRYTTPHTHGTFISDKLEDVFKTDNNSVKLVDITRHQLLNILVTSDGVIRERSESALFDIKCIFKWSCTRIPTLLLHKNVVIPRLCYGEESWVTRDPGSVFCRTALWEFFGFASYSLNDYHRVLWETGSKTPTQSSTRASSNSSQYCPSNQESWCEIYAVTFQTRPLGRFFYTGVICFTIFYKIFANFHFHHIKEWKDRACIILLLLKKWFESTCT